MVQPAKGIFKTNRYRYTSQQLYMNLLILYNITVIAITNERYKRCVMNEVATRISKLISEKGMSQSELAKRVGISKNTVQNWKKDTVYPSLAVIEKICEATGISVEQFFYGMGRREELNAGEKLLDSWRLLNDEKRRLFFK